MQSAHKRCKAELLWRPLSPSDAAGCRQVRTEITGGIARGSSPCSYLHCTCFIGKTSVPIAAESLHHLMHNNNCHRPFKEALRLAWMARLFEGSFCYCHSTPAASGASCQAAIFHCEAWSMHHLLVLPAWSELVLSVRSPSNEAWNWRPAYLVEIKYITGTYH